MKFEVSCGVFDTRVLKEALDERGGLFELEHVFGCSGFQLCFCSHRHLGTDGVLEIGIESLLGIELWAIARQVEEFDLIFALGGPRLNRFAGV